MKKARLWIIAGPNGAGKSTTIHLTEVNGKTHLLLGKSDPIPFINADIIAAKHFPETPPKDYTPAQTFLAGKQALKKRNSLLQANESFAIETTYSGNSELRLIQQAKKQGYEVNLLYIGINDANKTFARVEKRAEQGGHYISQEEVIRRYNRSVNQLDKTWTIFDNAYVFDNTGKEKSLLVQIERQTITQISATPPDWFKTTHKVMKLEYDKATFLNNSSMQIYDVPYPERYKAHQAGLSFNSFIKKYSSLEKTNLSPQQQQEWSILQHIDDPFLEKKVLPKLANYIEEQGYHPPTALTPVTIANLHKEENYQRLINDSSQFDNIPERLNNYYDAKLILIPSKKDIQAYFLDANNQLLETWQYKDKVVEKAAEENQRLQVLQVEQEKNYESTADKAQIIYDHLKPVQPYFEYLKKKNIRAYPDVKYIGFEDRAYFKEKLDWNTRYNQMAVPIRNYDGHLRSLQIINDQGDFKRFLTNGEIRGNFATIGTKDPRQADKIVIAEGYATAASIHESTGLPVVVAFQANNLLPVAKQFREANQTQVIYIGADNDYKSLTKDHQPNKVSKNIGIESALITAESIDAKVIYPPINNEQDAKYAKNGWDWNDYAAAHGKNQTRKEILSQIALNANVIEANEETQKRALLEKITLSKDDKKTAYFIAESPTEKKLLFISQINQEHNLILPHAFKDQKGLNAFIDTRQSHGYKVIRESIQQSSKSAVNASNIATESTVSHATTKETNEKKITLSNPTVETTLTPVTSMSKKLQKLNERVLQSAKKRNFTSEQMAVLNKRLAKKLESLHQANIKQQAKKNEHEK